MSLHIAKFFSPGLALASAALVIHIGAAAAAGSKDGLVVYGDAQAAARQLLLGRHPASDTSMTAEAQPQRHSAAYGDAQAAPRYLP